MTIKEKQTVGLTFYTRFDIRNQTLGRNFLSLIFEIGKDYSPSKIDFGKQWRSVEENNMGPILALWENSDNMLFRREYQYESELAILLGKTTDGYSIMTYWVDETYFDEEMHIQNFISLAIQLYNLIHPDYGWIHQTQDEISMATIQHPIYGPTIIPVNLAKGFPNIYWGNIFGPENVDSIGRDRLLSAPCYEILELSDGGILIRTSASPLYPNRDRKQQIVLRKYLGESFFYPTINNL